MKKQGNHAKTLYLCLYHHNVIIFWPSFLASDWLNCHVSVVTRQIVLFGGGLRWADEHQRIYSAEQVGMSTLTAANCAGELRQMPVPPFSYFPTTHTYNLISWVKVRLRTEVGLLRTPSSTRPGLELMTSRSCKYISCHWDACSNHLAIKVFPYLENVPCGQMVHYDLGNGCTFNSTKKPVTTMLIYPWKCTVLHCNHLGNTWKPLVLMTWHLDYCPSASEIGLYWWITAGFLPDLMQKSPCGDLRMDLSLLGRQLKLYAVSVNTYLIGPSHILRQTYFPWLYPRIRLYFHCPFQSRALSSSTMYACPRACSWEVNITLVCRQNTYFWIKYDLGQKYYAPQVRPDRGSNSWPPDHVTVHVTETPALTSTHRWN